jgi:2-keto-4-pentenoate hydratase/2-oxohepta-3-ene-1,7-dioic acid hydratase in catechol pathway
MKFCRFQPGAASMMLAGRAPFKVHPAPRLGIIEESSVREIHGDPFGEWRRGEQAWPLDSVHLLPPVVPGKIVCVGRNFAEHATELGNPIPKEPLLFLKPPSSVIGPEDPIVLPRISRRVDYEGELSAVIGRSCYQLGENDSAAPFVFGFTCLNDVTARDLQKVDAQFTRPKGFDTFCPIGPVMETEFDLAGASLETCLNGERKQFGRAAEMIFSVDVIIRWITQVMTLYPGDVVALGTPPGVGPLQAGDVVEVIASGIGALRNPVIKSE